jgi:hypothetical protein
MVRAKENSRILLLVEEETVLQNTLSVHGTKIWSWVPMGPETKNDCTGEGQKQITAPLSFMP